MALNIKSEEADRLARELARRRGQPITTVIIDALKAELARERRKVLDDGYVEKLLEIGKRFSALPVLDDRTEEEILGYDDMLK